MTSHLSSNFFKANRQRLLEQLPDDALVVLAAYSEMQRTADASFKFEQEASFYYLTGIEAPDWRLIIDKPSGREYLVAPEADPVKLLFDGGLTSETAKRLSGVADVIDDHPANNQLEEFRKRGRSVYCLRTPAYLKSAGFTVNPSADKLARQLKRRFGKVNDLTGQLMKLRTIKQPPEITAIEQAIAVTATAFDHVRSNLADYDYEYQIEADMTGLIRGSGARGHAYDPIVAGGANACTLHYIANDQPLQVDQPVLLDVGARSVAGYAADISRTYAVQPTRRQFRVHQAVAEAQAKCIDLLKPGLRFTDYQLAVDRIMKQAIRSLGLNESKYRDYFPHAIGHGLGLDVHDNLVGYDSLRPGMVMTVEPGIYIDEEGLGIRIEDDILITETGHRNLSAKLSTDLT
ncbi:MAG TPA: Xaa-Pro aminopeptidase [Candidatus Saccharimonadales bacterium]|nr:Xaa-Pro aminopeptidase [Candidatus Saccharimonadales bacterium]